ncbi:MAG: hypothetical protein IGR76_05370 [Synechococcales cyanobacterium T60_A2020_003]|nr:hypothetical protein [Synechococcales cyanobacterium T60_A2020_003]
MTENQTLDYQYRLHEMRRHPKQQTVSGGRLMRVLSLVLSAIALIAVGTVLCVCFSVVFGWPHLVRPIVWVAWGSIWRLGMLAIALFILITLVESLRS